ncbi:MAG: hypothetical protein RR945_06970 [Erysipelotrichaceae bacterium]
MGTLLLPVATSAITAEALAPIATTIDAALPVLLAVALPIFATVLGIRFIPKIVKMFAK